MDALIGLVVTLIIAGCVVGMLLYLVSSSPVPEPFKGWLWFVVMAIGVLIVIYVLLGFLPAGGHLRLLR